MTPHEFELDLSQEEEAVRMIGAVNSAVTVPARILERVGCVRVPEAASEGGRVNGRVALIAQPRPGYFQQVLVI